MGACVYRNVYMYIYIYIEMCRDKTRKGERDAREREREREKDRDGGWSMRQSRFSSCLSRRLLHKMSQMAYNSCGVLRSE